jgi:hypothetical protein
VVENSPSNVSPVYIEARERFDRTLVKIGLPER